MRCEGCGTELERPGDRCLACGSGHADAVVLELSPERAQLTIFDGEAVRGETTITTREDTAERLRERQRRNYVDRVVAEIRRKAPEGVYATGDRALLRRLRRTLAVDVFRIDDDEPVETYRSRLGESPLTVVEGNAASKLGGSHTSLIGDRRGRGILELVAEHPHVKKIVPGPIEAGGGGSRGGFRGKVTRADERGNLRFLLRDGSSVQTVRLVTTAQTRAQGRRIGEQLGERLPAVGD